MGNYFEFGTSVTNQSPIKLPTEEKIISSKGSNIPQKKSTNTSETKFNQNPFASALFKSKTHVTDIARASELDTALVQAELNNARQKELYR